MFAYFYKYRQRFDILFLTDTDAFLFDVQYGMFDIYCQHIGMDTDGSFPCMEARNCFPCAALNVLDHWQLGRLRQHGADTGAA